MVEIKPFRATIYNQEKISDVSKVVCPPYDVISPSDQEFYHKIHPYNFIRLILGRLYPDDNEKNNRYSRAKKLFDEWVEDRAFKKTRFRSFYFYLQRYTYGGQERERLGFIGLLRLAKDRESKIFPHENTQAAAKEDRFQLIEKVRANLSPIFVLFQDDKEVIETTFDKSFKNADPIIDVTDRDDVRHMLWCLDDKNLIAKLEKTVSGKDIFIADGHHRYEVGLAFRDHMKKMHKKKVTLPRSYEYLMTYFTDMNSDKLQILPVHRVVKKKINEKQLGEIFEIKKCKNKKELFTFLEKVALKAGVFGLYHKNSYSFLKIKDNKLYSNDDILDVNILQDIVFKKLRIDSGDVVFIKGAEQSIQMVDNSEAQAAFFLNSVRAEQLSNIASKGEKMPPKSTYFYPKVLSGLTINKFKIK